MTRIQYRGETLPPVLAFHQVLGEFHIYNKMFFIQKGEAVACVKSSDNVSYGPRSGIALRMCLFPLMGRFFDGFVSYYSFVSLRMLLPRPSVTDFTTLNTYLR